jgi:small subunit ribosomal protein S6
MRHYELTFIVDPVLSHEEIQTVRQTYEDQVKKQGCKIVHVDEIGLKQLAYPLNKRNSGIYFTIEFEAESGEAIAPLELAMRRDERIMRFLTIALDKFGVKYNEDKRNGLIRKTQRRRKSKQGDMVPTPTAKIPDLIVPELEEIEEITAPIDIVEPDEV